MSAEARSIFGRIDRKAVASPPASAPTLRRNALRRRNAIMAEKDRTSIDTSSTEYYDKLVLYRWDSTFLQVPPLFTALRIYEENITPLYHQILKMDMVKKNGKRDGYAYPSLAYLQFALRVSMPTLKKYIKILQQYGWIAIANNRGFKKTSKHYLTYPKFDSIVKLVNHYDLLRSPDINISHIAFNEDAAPFFNALFCVIPNLRNIYKEEIRQLYQDKREINSDINIGEIKEIQQKYIDIMLHQAFDWARNPPEDLKKSAKENNQ
jgi:hypothetical protein